MEETNQKQKIALRFWTIWNIAEAVILLAAGVLAIVFGCITKSENGYPQNIEDILTYSVATFVILDGLLRIIMNFLKQQEKTEESIMLIGGFEITLGIVMMVVIKTTFIEAMVYFMAIGMIVIGTLFLIFSILTICRKENEKIFMPVLEIIFGAILIGVGIFLIVVYNVNSESKFRISLILTGSVLAIAALAQMTITVLSWRKRVKKESAQETDATASSDEKKEKEPKKAKLKKQKPQEAKPEEEEPKVIEAKVQEIDHHEVPQIENKENSDEK